MTTPDDELKHEMEKRKRAEQALQRETHDLGERLKELNCLYGISALREEQGLSLEEVLQGIVDLLPPSWQYPTITCARIIVEGEEYVTGNFKETEWKQSGDIIVLGKSIGSVEVCYLEEAPQSDEGPFLKEEGRLIRAIAERVGRIIERNLAEEELLKERDRAQEYLDIAGVILVVINSDQTVSLINQKGSEILGYPAKDIIGKNWFDTCIPQEHRQEVTAAFRRLLAGEIDPVEYYENPVLTKRGEVRFIAWRNTVLRNDEGEITATLSSGEDITNRKQADEALRNALEQSRRHQAEISALLKAARAALECPEFSDAAQSIFKSCKDLLGATAGHVGLLSKDGAKNELLVLESAGLPYPVASDFPTPIRGLRRQAYRTGKPVYHNDFPRSKWAGSTPDGHVHLDNALFAPLVTDGKTLGLLGFANKAGGFIDNDARIASAFAELAAVAAFKSRTLESLQNSEQRLRSVVETACDAIVSIDSPGNVVFWNPGAEAMFGYSVDEMVGKPLTLIMPERFREAHQAKMNQANSAGGIAIEGRQVELYGLRRNGSEFPVELSLASWKAAGEVFSTGIVRDISERKQAEAALRQAHDELERRVEEGSAELVKSRDEAAHVRQTAGAYLSDEVVTEILASPEGAKPGGEMREMTVLVSDLRGFTSATESMEAPQIVKLINRWLEHMTDIIVRREGTIDEFRGDGILVFFGAPRALRDHTRRAVACALEMQESMKELNNENPRLSLPQLEMGIGINCGELVVGTIGSEKRKKYGAVGSPINAAFRIGEKARPREIVVTQAVNERLGDKLQIGGSWEESLKGMGNTAIYQVVGIRESQ